MDSVELTPAEQARVDQLEAEKDRLVLRAAGAARRFDEAPKGSDKEQGARAELGYVADELRRVQEELDYYST